MADFVLLQTKLPATITLFWIALFEAVLKVPVADYWAWSRGVSLYLSAKFVLMFLSLFLLIFLAKYENL